MFSLLAWLFHFWAISPFVFFLFGSGKGAEKQNAATGQNWGNTYNTEAGATLGTELPFLENELTNPTGLGTQTVNEMKTQSGEVAAGSAGQAKEAALLNASRTGNTAATPGIIDAAARNSQAGETTAANNVDIQNALLKNAQTQAASGGLESLYGVQTANALKSLGLSNQAAQEQTQASTAGVGDVLGILGAASGLGTAGANAYSTVENA